jgi:hypothetical protein
VCRTSISLACRHCRNCVRQTPACGFPSECGGHVSRFSGSVEGRCYDSVSDRAWLSDRRCLSWRTLLLRHWYSVNSWAKVCCPGSWSSPARRSGQSWSGWDFSQEESSDGKRSVDAWGAHSRGQCFGADRLARTAKRAALAKPRRVKCHRPSGAPMSRTEAGHYVRLIEVFSVSPHLCGPYRQENSVEATRCAHVTHGAGYTPIPTTPTTQARMATPSRRGTGTGSLRGGASMYILRATSR